MASGPMGEGKQATSDHRDEDLSDDYRVEDDYLGNERQQSTHEEDHAPYQHSKTVQEDLPRRIHILGTGSIGKLVAHALRGIVNPPPVTLILHRTKLFEAWQNGKKEITVQDGDDEHVKVSRGGFDVELQPDVRRQHNVEIRYNTPDVYVVTGEEGKPHEAAQFLKDQQERQAQSRDETAGPETDGVSMIDREGDDHNFGDATLQRKRYHTTPGPAEYAISNDAIHNLIVATKAPVTIPALNAIKHRLQPTSSICFLQNGMGIIDEVNQKLFPDPSTRPNYIQGIITHGVNVPPQVAAIDPFYVVHAGHGTIALGVPPPTDSNSQPHRSPQDWPSSSLYLIRTLTRTPVLSAVAFPPSELLQLQLEKLAVNSVLNPLTSLLDARNGSILYNYALTRTIRLLLAETSLVIRNLPELRNIPNVNLRFSPERLEANVRHVANATKDNISSMLADVRAGRRTEIEYINGYIVRRGEEMGINCVVNYAIMQTVMGKRIVTERELRETVPLVEKLQPEDG